MGDSGAQMKTEFVTLKLPVRTRMCFCDTVSGMEGFGVVFLPVGDVDADVFGDTTQP